MTPDRTPMTPIEKKRLRRAAIAVMITTWLVMEVFWPIDWTGGKAWSGEVDQP